MYRKNHFSFFVFVFGAALLLQGCAGGIRGFAAIGINPVGLFCGTTLTIKDGQYYRYLSDEQISEEGNLTTYAVKPIGTIRRRLDFGVRPDPPHGMFVYRVEWRNSQHDHWREIGHQRHGDNPYQFSMGRRAIGSIQAEVRVIYRYATVAPSTSGDMVIVNSTPEDRNTINPDDKIVHYLIPITFAHSYCDLN